MPATATRTSAIFVIFASSQKTSYALARTVGKFSEAVGYYHCRSGKSAAKSARSAQSSFAPRIKDQIFISAISRSDDLVCQPAPAVRFVPMAIAHGTGAEVQSRSRLPTPFIRFGSAPSVIRQQCRPDRFERHDCESGLRTAAGLACFGAFALAAGATLVLAAEGVERASHAPTQRCLGRSHVRP